MAHPSLIPGALGGHIYSVTQRATYQGQNIQFGFYFQSVGPVNVNNVPAEEGDVFTYWQGTIVPLLRPILNVGTVLRFLRTWCMTWPQLATQVISSSNLAGTFAGDGLPPQIALVLSKSSNLRGKSGRGRMYLGGMSETGSLGGEPTPAQLLPANLLGQQLRLSFIGAVTGTTFNPVIISLLQYKLQSIAPGPPPVPIPPPILNIKGSIITNVVADQVYNTQRRRTFGRGE